MICEFLLKLIIYAEYLKWYKNNDLIPLPHVLLELFCISLQKFPVLIVKVVKETDNAVTQ